MENLTPKYDTCFFERYAMITLETMLGKHYAHLVNRDRPDLQDEKHSIGIEVTRAIRENKNVAKALVNEMAGKPILEIDQDDLNNISRSGYAYGLGDGSLVGSKEFEYWSLALPMKRIIESKVYKVNNGFYGQFKEFGLFIFAKEDLNDEGVRQVMDFIIKEQQDLTTCYDKLFISQIQTLYACDLKKNVFKSFAVGKRQRRLFYNKSIPA